MLARDPHVLPVLLRIDEGSGLGDGMGDIAITLVVY
jgi:hypothetical protein